MKPQRMTHQRALRTPQKKGSTAAVPSKIHTSDKPTANTSESCEHKEKERVSSFSAERDPSEAPADDVTEICSQPEKERTSCFNAVRDASDAPNTDT